MAAFFFLGLAWLQPTEKRPLVLAQGSADAFPSKGSSRAKKGAAKADAERRRGGSGTLTHIANLTQAFGGALASSPHIGYRTCPRI